MNRILMGVAVSVLSLMASSGGVRACDRVPAGPVRVAPGAGEGDSDLEELGSKLRRGGNLARRKAILRSRALAARGPASRPSPSAEAATTERPPVSRGASRNEQIVKTVLVQQALVAQNVRLQAKRAELERWDRPAREKFLRAFGTTDEAARERVLRRIDGLLERNFKALVAIADNVNFESYLESRKAR